MIRDRPRTLAGSCHHDLPKLGQVEQEEERAYAGHGDGFNSKVKDEP
jgi:hypothetical protein